MRQAGIVVCFGLGWLAGVAQGDIGVNFAGGAPEGNVKTLGDGYVRLMRGTEVAGVIPRARWNNAGLLPTTDKYINDTGSIGLLRDGMGVPVEGVSVSWTCSNTFSNPIPDKPGNNRMMRGYLDSIAEGGTPASVTITLPKEFEKTGYDLYVYFDGNTTFGDKDRIGQYCVYDATASDGQPIDQIFGVDKWKVNFSGAFVECKGKSAKEATPGNYVVFRRLKIANIKLVSIPAVPGDVTRAPINGIQIIGGAQESGEADLRAALAGNAPYSRIGSPASVAIAPEPPELTGAARVRRQAVQSALNAYWAGRFRDSLDAAKAIADGDKQNGDALAITGLASFRIGNTGSAGVARTYFTALAALDANSVLAENNIGVICCQQKQYSEGLAHFYKALQINSDQRTLLDNVAEAINSYLNNGGDTKAAIYLNARKLFDAAEAQMEAKMAKLGMVRRGGLWLTKQEVEKLNKREEYLQRVMQARDTEFKVAQAELPSWQQRAKQSQEEYVNASANLAQLNIARQRSPNDATANAAYGTTAQLLQKIQNAGQEAVQQQAEVQDEIKELTAEAAKLKAIAASLRAGFTGTWNMIELDEGDGTVARHPAAPQAATVPTGPSAATRRAGS